MSGINVLLIAGSGESSFCGTLAELAAESSLDGIRVSVFDSLDELPPFSDTAASVELPGSVDAMRNAAAAADAVSLLTHYYAPARWTPLTMSRPISREIPIVRRHTIADPMLSPKTTAPVHGGATMSC